MFQLATCKQSPWRIFLKSFSLLKSTFKKCLPFTVVSGILVIISTSIILKSTFAQAHGAANTSGIVEAGITAIIFNLLSMLIMCCIILQVKRVLDSSTTSFGAVLKQGLVRGIISVLSLIAFMIAFYIAVFIIFIVLHFIPVVGTPLAIALIAIGSIYLFINIFSWLPLMIDGGSPIQSLKRSFALVKKNWWRTLLLLLLTGIVIFVVELIVGAVSGISMTAGAGTTASLSIIGMVVLFLVILVFPAWIWGVIWLQIKDLELRNNTSN